MKNYTDEMFFDSPFRGVTSVLNAIFGNKFENSGIPEHVLRAAGERGTACHAYLEDYQKWLLGEIKDEPHLGLEYANYEYNIREFLKERIDIVKILATEQKMISNQLFMKGILDAVWTVKNKDDGREYTCLIDFKTSSNLDEWITNCQMQLYYYMLLTGSKEERALADQIQELRCLSITRSGYRWFKFDIDFDLINSLIILWNKNYCEVGFKEKKIVNPEIWKDIKGYEGLYEVSNYGRIKASNNLQNKIPTILTPVMKKNGYLCISLCKKGEKTISKQIHRLVAEAFCEKKEGADYINHIDCDKTNNYYKNLEYCTPKENAEHAVAHNLGQFKAVQQISLETEEVVGEFKSIAEANRFLKKKSTATSICSCCKGKIPTAFGYKWKYKED